MDDAISREQAIKAIEEEWDGCCSEYPATQIIYDTTEAIERIPAIQPKRGRWHYSDGKPATIGLSFGVVCDQCGTESEYCTNFCGECGADMREVNHESN